MTIRRLIYFSDRAAGLLGTISSSTVNAAIEKAYGAPAPAQTEQQPVAWRWMYNGEPDGPYAFNHPLPDDDVVWRGLMAERPRTVQPLYADPIAQSAPQPEQSGLRAGQVVAMCEVGHDRLERAALDTKRLEWMLAERCIIESQNGTGSPAVYRVAWPGLGEAQSEWYPTEREAIDHARGCRHE